MQTTRHTTLFTLPQITDHPLPPTDNGSFFTLPQITPITLTILCELFSPSRKEPLRLCGEYCPQGFKP